MPDFSLAYIAAGGNRHPSAADWKPGILAFGAGKNLAIWDVDDGGRNGISQLLSGHEDDITAVRIYGEGERRLIITGSADKTLRTWHRDGESGTFYTAQTLDGQGGSINAITALERQGMFVSGSADGSLMVWNLADHPARSVQMIALKPRFIPLSCALVSLEDDTIVLAVAGTTDSIQIHARPASSSMFSLQATLSGHEGWIRSLDFAHPDSKGDVLLASASQDKYIRLWRFHEAQQEDLNGTTDPVTAVAKKSLSNKAHQVGSEDLKYNVTFEALLVGHEDWIYTVRWALPKDQNDLRLLSSSADNSLAIWEADQSSGVWICQTRLGEISAQKGSTTATGSTGGFWIGLWQPDGTGVVSLGRTGSWRRWRYDPGSDLWLQQNSISGHVKEGQGLSWAPDGSYLLSTSSDQTTRLWSEWERNDGQSWHEFARPQIHGYDLKCIAALTPNRFISGADEKLLRVFDKPKVINELLARLCGHQSSVDGELPDTASIPVLGLSNKPVATSAADEQFTGTNGDGNNHESTDDPTTAIVNPIVNLVHAPLEEHLARHTLFPEHEKLYGHGYEISALAASPSGSIIATACKASSIDHAVVRLYECASWREVKPPLKAHSLTATALAFSPREGEWLLSVGRDRQWVLWRKGAENTEYALWKAKEKGHSRMILDCAWAPAEVGTVFATAGRDKMVKIWRIEGEEVQLATTITASAAVTAVNIASTLSAWNIRLAYGTEEGSISIVDIAPDSLQAVTETGLPLAISPSAAINALRWRPQAEHHGAEEGQLAVASDDCSIRIVNVGDGRRCDQG